MQRGRHLWQQVVQTIGLLTQHYRPQQQDVVDLTERLRGAATANDILQIQRRVFVHQDGPNRAEPQ